MPVGFAARGPLALPAGGSLLLDTLTAVPLIAVSTRQLRTGFTSPPLRCRRNDTTEQDIPFSSGSLDTANLLAFTGVGGGDSGWLTLYYNQAVSPASGTNVTQTVTTSQPLLTASGTPYTRNGKTTPLLGIGNDYLNSVPSVAIPQPLTVCMCLESLNTPWGYHACDGSGGTRVLVGSDTAPTYGIYSGGTPAGGGTQTSGMHTVIGVFASGSNDSLYVDGTQIIGPVDTGSHSWESQYIGRAGESYWDGYFTEILVFGSAIDSTDMATIRTSWQTYWGAP